MLNAASECTPSHIHSSDSRFSHCSELRMQILYKIISAPKTHCSVVSEIMVVPHIYHLQLYGNPSKVIAFICEHVIF